MIISERVAEETKNKDVLIVEDNDFNMMTLQDMLKVNFSLDTASAYNGLEAIELI